MNPRLACSTWLPLLLVLFTLDQGRANPVERGQEYRSLSKRFDDDSTELILEPRASEENGPPYQPLVPRASDENVPPAYVPLVPRASDENVPPPLQMPLIPRASEQKGPPFNPPPFVDYEPRAANENALRKLIKRSFERSPGRNKRLSPGDGCFGQKIDRIGAVSGMGCNSVSSQGKK
uniref:Preprohelokinestatin-1 protein n=1 Tax=Heloderma suspectum TaxID=8554 RepID=D7FB56_HELSU|nr:preprohelokinestatin-1 protein [Heloderma suspectum]